MKKLIWIGGLLALCSCGQESTPVNISQDIQPRDTGLTADSGMVVSAHAIASQVGIDVLKKGGNAYDAAVAVQFALAVVYPNAGNIGGGGFLVLRTHQGEYNALDFRETAPAMASRNMYLDKNGKVIEDMSGTGVISSGVPGSVDGMMALHKKYGKLSWQELVQPSVDLAAKGFPITEKQAKEFNKLKSRFFEWNRDHQCALLKKDTADWVPGETLIQPELARTLERVRDKGREGFYDGPVAESIVREMKRAGGIITLQDLRSYRSVWRTPVTGWFRDLKVVSMPPPSSGGVVLMQLLNMVENYDLKGPGYNSSDYISLLTEAERRAYADRAVHLGDPDFYSVPMKEMLDSGYIVSRMKDYDPKKATSSAQIQAGSFSNSKEKEETTHFSIVDQWHNAVSVTTTINGSYGNFVFVPGAGFLLNNEMDDFSVKPGVPNAYGLIGAEANSIAPGKRMLSSMTPTIVEKRGKLYMVLGTPGGSTIITSVFQTLLNVTEHRMTMHEAVNAKKFHHQWRPDTIFMEENAMDSTTISALTAKGYTLMKRGPIGRTDCILVLPDDRLEGGADKRGDDAAAGY